MRTPLRPQTTCNQGRTACKQLAHSWTLGWEVSDFPRHLFLWGLGTSTIHKPRYGGHLQADTTYNLMKRTLIYNRDIPEPKHCRHIDIVDWALASPWVLRPSPLVCYLFQTLTPFSLSLNPDAFVLPKTELSNSERWSGFLHRSPLCAIHPGSRVVSWFLRCRVSESLQFPYMTKANPVNL